MKAQKLSGLILMILLLSTHAQQLNAQAYLFEIDHGTFKGTGRSYVRANMTEGVIPNEKSPLIHFQILDGYDQLQIPQMNVYLSSIIQNGTTFYDLKSLVSLISSDINQTAEVNFILTLSNFETLSGQCSLHHADQANFYASQRDGFAACCVYIDFASFVSSDNPYSIGSKEALRYACQQLRKYDITQITICKKGTYDFKRFDVSGLRSASTIDAMFKRISEETKKETMYESFTSITMGSVNVGVLSKGEILFSINNLNINNAMGKEITAELFFENLETGVWEKTGSKVVVPQSQNSHYNVLVVRAQCGNLSNLRRNRGRLRVYAQFTQKINGKDYVICDSPKKTFNLYYDGWWKSN